MTRSDDEILEFLAKEGAGTPKMIGDAIGSNSNYIGRRCRTLESYGLVNRPSRGFYTLSEEGEQYLEGELDAALLSSE
ncbi:hypothetical protein [Halostagnicola sp. A56]|uniref:hypothetical protein n=1 Tax=Halostagnicola sp. A56 TaxID=1495067 RepID=UPI001E2FAAFE|nr:hypothetical protein [Halostagnicola sp. A56]